MQTIHTAAPWFLAGDDEGTMIADAHGEQIAMWPPQGGTVEQCANARLIAACPDLVAALQALAIVAESVAHLRGLEREILPATDAARAALNKALGE